MGETNWVQVFFAILSIVLILWVVSSFFGISIPNWRGIQIKTENAFSDLEHKINITRTETISNGLDSSYSYAYLYCAVECNKDSTTENLKLYGFDSYYFDTDDFMICKCKRLR